MAYSRSRKLRARTRAGLHTAEWVTRAEPERRTVATTQRHPTADGDADADRASDVHAGPDRDAGTDHGAHLGPDTEWLADGATLDYRAADDRRPEFVDAARRFIPDIEPDDLAPGHVGYRAKLSKPGQPPRDFLIWHDHGYVHLGGIESPGMTASLAIARHVSDLLRM